jgi:hypothetical protein
MSTQLFDQKFFTTVIKLHDDIKSMSPTFSILPTAMLSLLAELAYLPSKNEVDKKLEELPSRLHHAALAERPFIEGRAGFFGDLRWQNFVVYVSDSLISYVVDDDKCIVVAHRGTNDWADIRKDFDPRYTSQRFDDQEIWFHKGFYRALEQNYSLIEKHVLTLLMSKERPVYITGHSLGGAVTLINGLKFKAGPPLLSKSTWGAYSFGAPPTATKGVRKLLFTDKGTDESRLRYYRIVRYNDPVPNSPLMLPWGFIQSGISKYITPKITLENIIPISQRFLAMQLIDTWTQRYPSSPIFSAHNKEKYRKDLFEIAGRPSMFNWDQ